MIVFCLTAIQTHGRVEQVRRLGRGGGGTPCNGLYEEASLKRAPFLGLRYMKWSGLH